MKSLPIAGLLLCLASATAAAQNADVYKRLVPSNTLRVSALTERTTTSAAAVLVKEFFVSYGGAVRLKWTQKSDGANGASVVINLAANDGGGAHACEGVSVSASYVPQACDFAVRAGDRIQVYLVSQNGQTVAMKNAKLFFSIVQADKPSVVLLD